MIYYDSCFQVTNTTLRFADFQKTLIIVNLIQPKSD